MDMRQLFSEMLVVEAQPTQPWLSPCQDTSSLFVANPLIIGLAATALVSVGAVIYKGRVGLVDEEEPQTSQQMHPILQTLSPATKAMASGIIGAYIRALESVEGATGVALRPEMTLRDLLDLLATHPDMGQANRPFEQLTTLAERALYSPEILEIGEERWANLLCHIIQEELQG
jgi:hypothetical protein